MLGTKTSVLATIWTSVAFLQDQMGTILNMM